ncbi:FlgM family anti-sigma-28 factor [Paraperlucidibaca baekdonensis]|uniref:Negative regulator of flagellin synthesis n=1 Tax=Paraperlucidibaca baekdonensis TaxID=748120 RepID=A0A3E0H1K1_9GAMM|nr:flagellar biosynthesis anti-sigma factor FlgM [Paraperlucidibaca baekdonensis]REH36736.1 FlgM family anti-sigma-28 factor [Paraperlucidibaca baekdonensis]
MVDNISSLPPKRLDVARNEATKSTDALRESRAAEASARTEDTKATSHSASNSLVDRAKAAAHEAPEIDRQKVDDIKLAIARGEFQVNPKAVAQAFVSMTLNATRA